MDTPPLLDWTTMSVGTMNWYQGQLYPICGTTSSASATWPTANLAIFLPFYVRAYMPVKSVWWITGATASGNVDMGIYDEPGNRLYHTGSTAQGSINTKQVVTVSGNGILLSPRRYWLGLAMDNTTGTVFRWSNDAVILNCQKMFCMQQMASAFPLPATITFAAAVNAFIPHMGLLAQGGTLF